MAQKNVLITGASSGLGMDLAVIFARAGYDLVIIARRLEKLKQLKTEWEAKFGIKVFIVAADLSQPQAPLQIFQAVRARGLTIDILINNAGMGVYGDFVHADFNKIAMMYQVNVLSSLHLTKLFLGEMTVRKSGHVVNVSSIGGLFPGPLMAAYFAGKADILSFTRALAYELRGTGVHVSAICPGPFKTEFQQKTFGQDSGGNLVPSQLIAEEIYQDILKNKLIIIPRLSNKIIYSIYRWLPSSLVLHYVYKFHKNLIKNCISRINLAP